MESIKYKMLQGERVHDAVRKPTYQKINLQKANLPKVIFQITNSLNSLTDNCLEASLPNASF